MAQRGSLQRITRFKGPTAVTIRGAGSTGNDPLTKGQFTDPAFDIQIPLLQTGNALQVTKPDGTIIFQIGPNANFGVTAITASGAVPVSPTLSYAITKGSIAVLTLAAPTVTTMDGVELQIFSTTAFAHTLTATGLFQTGTASVNLATFAAFAGAGLVVVAYQGKWVVTSSVGITFS